MTKPAALKRKPRIRHKPATKEPFRITFRLEDGRVYSWVVNERKK